MALIIETKILCDRCRQSEFVHDKNLTGFQQRKQAKKSGWGRTSVTDICPNCIYKKGRGNKEVKLNQDLTAA